jgi:proteic killer suppression protein
MVIQSIRHKGLCRFHATGSTAGIQPSHARKLRMRLAALETAITIEDMNLRASACILLLELREAVGRSG